MERAHLDLTLCAAVLLAVGGAARAEYESRERQRVTTRVDYPLSSDDGYLWAWETWCDVTSFTPAPAVDIAPGSGDPGVVTAVPTSLDDCSWEFYNGQAWVQIWVEFESLRDLGQWDITCFGTWVDPAKCEADDVALPCGVRCAETAVDTWLNEYTFHIEVYNDEPTASITHSPAPAWNAAVSLRSDAEDPDGGSPSCSWSITERPDDSSTNLADSDACDTSIRFTSDDDIGYWVFGLYVDDNEGERRPFSHSFTVPNGETAITIDGPVSVEATDPIELEVSPLDDVDGGALTIRWSIDAWPHGPQPPSNFDDGFAGPELLHIETTDADIGEWAFTATAEDDENYVSTATWTVTVENKLPEITFLGSSEIDVDDAFDVKTTIVDDADGGVLTFEWFVVQAPDPAGVSGVVGTEAELTPRVTTEDDAGTWIFELTATDDERDSTSDTYTVLVDAVPIAVIDADVVKASDDFPLVLSSAGSTDPDTDVPHTNVDGPVADLSGGIVERTWTLLDVPPELWETHEPGRVDEVLGVDGRGVELSLRYDQVGPGYWLFGLDVVDEEGNREFAEHSVQILPPNSLPTAVVSPPVRYEVDALGNTIGDVTTSGADSFDLDNVLAGEALGPGVGIDTFTWTAEPPLDCAEPALPDGEELTLYPAGTFVSPECLGVWGIELTVYDDNVPQYDAAASTTVTIGNCPTQLCIDSPTNGRKAVVEYAADTDVWISYTLDAALYDEPDFGFGIFVTLDVAHESAPDTPVYSDTDYNVLASGRGGLLRFHWNGSSIGRDRPARGLYDVHLNLLDYGWTPGRWARSELGSIVMAVAEVEVLGTSDALVSHPVLAGGDMADFQFRVAGVTTHDELRWRIRNAAAAVVREETIAPSIGSQFSWNGLDNGGTRSDPGEYTAEIEAFRAGASMGASNRFPFTVYRLTLQPTSGPVTATPPGLVAYVNDDDDDMNHVADDGESHTAEDDLVELELRVEPALTGTARLTITDAPPPFRLWQTRAKAAAVDLANTYALPGTPPPASVWLEAVDAGASNLSLEVTTDGGTALDPTTMALSLVDLDVVVDSDASHTVDATDARVFALSVALWDHAYDAAFNVNNAADPANYVEQDTRRFYLRVEDTNANANQAVPETITVQLASVDGGGAADDAATDVTLTETGPNTALFASRSQLLVSQDIQVADDPDADDEHATHSGPATGGAVADDAAGDRNHRVVIDGTVVATYQPTGASTAHAWRTPVCARQPEERRRVELRTWVFNEPYQDVGHDHDGNPTTPVVDAGNGTYDVGEPFLDLSAGAVAFATSGTRGGVVEQAHVDAQVERANVAWAQACIRVESLGTTFVDAPVDGAGIDILADGVFSFGGTDEAAMIAAYAAGATVDVVEMFFVAPMGVANAVTRGPVDGVAGMGENIFIYLAPRLQIESRTLAHELGHALDNGFDAANPQPIFYPAHTLHRDDQWGSYRRVTGATVARCRTPRAAADMAGAGNRLLKLP